MDNVCTMAEPENYKKTQENIKKEFVTNWLNSTTDDDADSILSDSTAISSSLAETDDLDLNSLKISDTDNRRMSSTSSGNNTMAFNQIDLLQKIFNKDGNIQTVGNVNIENSSQVHIGNVTYITGPIHITNPSDPYMKILFNENTKTINTNVTTAGPKPKVPTAKEEEEVWKYEETNRDDAFLGSIKRRNAEGVLRIIDRRTWLAQKPMEPYVHIKEPVEYVIISHSATESATTQADNVYLIRNIQCFHIESRRWNDIGYNFMIGCDGNVYEGRGWGVVGAHTQGYNTFSVGICFIGCFMRELPPADSLRACKNFIKSGVENGYIVPDYKLICHCQCSPTESPGRKLFDEIKTWDHFTADL